MRASKALLRVLPLSLLATIAVAQDPDEEEEVLEIAPPMRMAPKTTFEFADMAIDGGLVAPSGQMLSATAGGAQDIGHFRDLIARGVVPPEASLTAEGLFSEHDLPIVSSSTCDRLLCPVGQAVKAELPAAEEVEWLAQLGFTSSLDAATFQRPPLDIVAVVDRSCSMTGEKFETVRASLRTVADELGPNDKLTIVTYGSSVDVELAPTQGDDPRLTAAIDALTINGSTNLEAGLTKGFAIAREERRQFDGIVRVMLFTDERPNVGRTDAQSFAGMAEKASHDGVGLTTIGVGTDFGSELATKVSNVRGGNLFFFANPADMQEKFAEDFDLMAVELAYDLDLVVNPAPGTRIVDVWGIPGSALERTEDGGMKMSVKTLFASKEGGGIYFGFAPDEGAPVRPGRPVGSVTMAYTARDGGATSTTVPFLLVPEERAAVGLVRGAHLVDEVTSLRASFRLWSAGDGSGALLTATRLGDRLAAANDDALAPEVKLVREVEQVLRANGAEIASR